MFTRVLPLKNLSQITKNAFVKQQFGVTSKYPFVQASRYLYVKKLDRDVGLETQRIANKSSNVCDEESKDDHGMLSNKFEHINVENIEETGLNQNLSKSQDHVKPLNVTFGGLNDDPDVFGNAPKEPVEEDEDDIKEEEYISRPTRRSKKLRTKEYAKMIKDHLNSHRLMEAIEVLEIRMLKEDRVKPENYIYNLLISGCAKAGYTRKAFSLYTKMRQRGLKVKESTYTSLFNACANAPSRQDGLTRAIRLRESLLNLNYEFNEKNYNVMIKTFGRWGDVKTAYILADEMRDKRLVMNGETFNFLLQACASDEKHGFRHCLLTWHKMLAKNIKPDYYTFNTVLRCVRDCGFGDLEEMEKVLQQILEAERTKSKIENKFRTVPDAVSSTTVDKDYNSENLALDLSSNEKCLQIENDAINLELPNLLLAKPHLGSMVSLSEVKKPHERFLLLGGLTGFLELMKSYKITPDIQTFTTMLECIPPTNTAEKQLMTFIRKIGLKADIDFFNILIKKRAMRFDYEGGKEVLSMIRTAGLYPDIVTYGVLALGCTTIESSAELLEQMRQNNIRMNIQILGAMLRQGCGQKNFPYVCEIMQISLDERIKPNEIFLRHLNKFYLECARAIDSRYPPTKTKSFKKQHMKFCKKYRMYQEENGIEGLTLEDAIKKIKERPYSQYSEEKVEGMEPLKNEKLSRKNKLRKYIKKIKIQNLKGDEDLAEPMPALPYSSDMSLQNEVVSSQYTDDKENNQNPFKKAQFNQS